MKLPELAKEIAKLQANGAVVGGSTQRVPLRLYRFGCVVSAVSIRQCRFARDDANTLAAVSGSRTGKVQVRVAPLRAFYSGMMRRIPFSAHAHSH